MRGLIAGWILLLPLCTQAGVYQCTDAAGKVSFQEKACAASESSREITLKPAQVVHSENPLPKQVDNVNASNVQRDRTPALHPDAPGGENFCRKLAAQYNNESQNIVAACKRGRNNYCGQSAEEIAETLDRQWLRNASDAEARNYERNNASGSTIAALKEKIRLYNC